MCSLQAGRRREYPLVVNGPLLAARGRRLLWSLKVVGGFTSVGMSRVNEGVYRLNGTPAGLGWPSSRGQTAGLVSVSLTTSGSPSSRRRLHGWGRCRC